MGDSLYNEAKCTDSFMDISQLKTFERDVESFEFCAIEFCLLRALSKGIIEGSYLEV